MIDRDRLAAWGLGLDDDDFARACAALGALNAAQRRLRRRVSAQRVSAGGSFARPRAAEWSIAQAADRRDGAPLVAWELPALQRLPAFPAALELAQAWQRYLDDAPWGTRLAVYGRGRDWQALLPLLRVLQQPAVSAAAVFVADAFAADGRVDWALPFRLCVLADDPLANAFGAFRAHWREPWPYRFMRADRAVPRVEVMVFSGSLRAVAARLLARGAPCRAAFALVLGGTDVEGGQDGGQLERLVRVVADVLAAEGVACVRSLGTAGVDVEQRMPALVRLGDELTHNLPLDIALRQAFGADVLAFLNRDLIRLSHLASAADRLAGRLKAAPAQASLALSERTLAQLIGTPGVVEALEQVRPSQARGLGRVAQAVASAGENLRSVAPRALARGIDASRERYRYVRESDEASSLTEAVAALAAVEAVQAAEQPETRYVQHGFWRREGEDLVEEHECLRVGEQVLLRLRIGPPGEGWQTASEAFPAHELPPRRRRHRLQVVFHEPLQLDAPLTGVLWLPRSGPSSVLEFVLTPRMAAAFEGRISVLHRGRVLQTVLIHAQVVEQGGLTGPRPAITQQVEARVREHWSDLGSRRRFDASFVLNHTHGARPLLTGIAGRRAWATDLSGIQEPVDAINRLLSEVAYSVADYSAGLTTGDNLALFFRLARLGGDLYSALVIDHLQALNSGGMDVDEATHIQIVSTRADAVVPFEFIYQYVPPDDEGDVRFCPDALEALAAGACPGHCAGQQDPRRHVCPMGFWGLRKVIERHVFNPALGRPGDAEVLVQAEPAGDRLRLQLDRSALVGYSAELRQEEVGPLIRLLEGRMQGAVREVKDWDEWRAAVGGERPTLLVAFPHNTGDKQDVALEIGGKPFKTLRLPREYVHIDGPYPLVLLLGCDVASTAQQYASHIRYFRQAGAAAVVSTIATVFGPHAVKVGEKILDGLLAAAAGLDEGGGAEGSRCLGEVLRAVKRQALLDSLPMALCVVAFGDADWRL